MRPASPSGLHMTPYDAGALISRACASNSFLLLILLSPSPLSPPRPYPHPYPRGMHACTHARTQGVELRESDSECSTFIGSNGELLAAQCEFAKPACRLHASRARERQHQPLGSCDCWRIETRHSLGLWFGRACLPASACMPWARKMLRTFTNAHTRANTHSYTHTYTLTCTPPHYDSEHG